MENISIQNVITTLSLIIMTLLVRDNSRIDKTAKRKFYLSYLFLFLAMEAERAGILLNEAPLWTSGIHRVVKFLDYCLTPVICYTMITQVAQKNKVQKFIGGLLSFNAIFQFLSIFTGWSFYVDQYNIYHHGPFYVLYIIIYMMTFISFVVELYLYSKQYKKQNIISFFSIVFMILFSIIIQEMYNYRVTYLMWAIAETFIFIYYTEFTQLVTDDNLEYQQQLIDTDPLTGLYSRYSYTEALKELKVSVLLVVFSVDINELKSVNDTLGHLAGDEIIQGAAECLKKVFGNYGKTYRTGGDEFIAFLYIPESEAYRLKHELLKEASKWHGKRVNSLTLSVGYAVGKHNLGIDISKLIHLADEKMYEAKAQFYMQSGKNRRSNRRKTDRIEAKQKEYIDIISAFANDATGLYVIDRNKREVTAYRLSALDHNIQSGVPLEQGFEMAMEKFIEKNVHPDDKEFLRQGIQFDFIERELSNKKSFTVHFRTQINGQLTTHYMKCIRNKEFEEYDKIIISFHPEENVVIGNTIQKVNRTGVVRNTILAVCDEDNDNLENDLKDNFNLHFTNNKDEAIRILKEHYREISLILYDANLECIEFLEAISKDVFLSSVPVLVLEDNSDANIKKRCLELGVIDFIKKPYDSVIINSRIRNIINMKILTDSLDEIEIDELTKIYTKQAFLYHAKTLIESSPNESFTVIILDIQNFKIYNEVYGETKGDELLKDLADIIHIHIRYGIYARYGADRFVLAVKTKEKEKINELTEIIQHDLTKKTMENVIVKFGIYEDVDRNIAISRMCDRALFALKSIKHNSDRSYAYFDGPLSQQQFKAQMYESRFKEAMDNKEFIVWYQPKYNPYTGNIVGAEALIRWRLEDGRLMSPSEFLPAFEQNRLISQLDEFVFRTVCQQQRRWKDAGQKLIPVSVNISRNGIHKNDIVDRYKKIVDECGISPKLVPIEITETAAIGNVTIKPLVDAFYEAGFSLHMDDFGSGKSSIAGLALLHFDSVKFDKSLIDFIGTEHGNLVLMYTMALAKELGLHVIAEGVETFEQVNYLRDIGCEVVQGYYYNKPLPLDAFEMEMMNHLESATDNYDYRNKFTAADSVVKRAMDRVIQRMPGGFFTYKNDEDQRILSSNSYLWKLYGCTSEQEFMEHVGGTFRGMVAPNDLSRVEKHIERQIKDNNDEMDHVEYHIMRKDGKRIKVTDYGHLDHQADGDIFYVFISEI